MNKKLTRVDPATKEEVDESLFEQELAALLNSHSKENDSDTPDFLLAEFLLGCLKVYTITSNKRDDWYSFDPKLWSLTNETTKE